MPGYAARRTHGGIDARADPAPSIAAASLAPWVQAGATGFGIGSQLFRPGAALEEIGRAAREFVAAGAAAAPR